MQLFSTTRSRLKTESGRFNVKVTSKFEAGYLSCQKCKARIELEGLNPLTMTECPKCRMMNFIPLKIADFWLFQPLGGGGMGAVYKASKQDDDERFFAVKVLARNGKDKLGHIHALLNETHISKQIGDHPNLVSCIDGGWKDDEYFCALEFVGGERLDKRIERSEGLKQEEVLKYALDILSAEQHIYDEGYLYRDMKPENIMITPDDKAILYDYGLCISRNEALNPEDEFVSGSPYYLPPERLWGISEDAYSEIYSLGMVMFYALSNQTFYNATEVNSLAKRHVSKLRIPIEKKLKHLRPEMVALISRMIAQEPSDRYQTYQEVVEEIKRVKAVSSG